MLLLNNLLFSSLIFSPFFQEYMPKILAYIYDPRRVSSRELLSHTDLEALQAMSADPSIAVTLGFCPTHIEAAVLGYMGFASTTFY